MPLRLTTDPAREDLPAWSPDGQNVAFRRCDATDCAIVLAPALGGPGRELLTWKGPAGLGSQTFGGVSWSPDGRWLAVSHAGSKGFPFRVALLSPETLETRPLTSPGELMIGDVLPAFSPDGDSVAFFRFPDYMRGELWVKPLADGPARQLTTGNYQSAFGAAWSQDGDRIALSGASGFHARIQWIPREGGVPQPVPSLGEGITYPATTRNARRLAYSFLHPRISKLHRIPGPRAPGPRASADVLYQSSREFFGPDYSPDGRQIALGSHEAGHQEIWVRDADGRNPRQLTFLEGSSSAPRWSPDGEWLAFDVRKGEASGIYVVQGTGGPTRQLTQGGSTDAVPRWSRDGHSIYFTSLRSSQVQIWRVARDGGEPVQLTRNRGQGGSESEDGTEYYYNKGQVSGIWRMALSGGTEELILDREVDYMNWFLLEGRLYFMTGDWDGDAYLWKIEALDLGTGEISLFHEGRNEGEIVRGLAISPSGDWILTNGRSRDEADIMYVENFR